MVTGGGRAVARCDALGVPPYSDTSDGLFRAWLTPAFAATQDAIAGWMREAGMTVRIDAATNLIGRYEGGDPDAPALIIGSHIDSVRDAGRYDGPLGVMLGIECVAALDAVGRRLPFAIEVYAFGDEEGSRFPSPMLTTRAVASGFDPLLLEDRDADGISVAEALVAPAALANARRRPADILAYLEAHIEQGPVLEAEGLPVGIVTGIASQLRCAVTVTGKAGHAGTTTMGLRRDALAAAAEMVLAVEDRARSDRSDLVATVGSLRISPGAVNVIAGRVQFTIDIRSADALRRNRAAEAIQSRIRVIARTRGVDVAIDETHDLPASPCNPKLMDMLAASVQEQGVPVRRLVSGAGHDAMVMAALCPTAMLFIRCAGGISHNPAESVDVADVDVALAAMLGFIDRLGGQS